MFSPNATTSSGNSTTGGGGGGSSATHSAGASTATSSSSKSNAGPIAGGVVGGVAGLALIGLGIFLFRRRRQQASAAELAAGHNLVEKDGSAVKTNNEMLADTQYVGPPAELPGGVGMYEPQELSPANYTREVK